MIDTLTPWAKCLVVSGTASISHPKALSSFLGYKIRWVIKGRIRSPESLRADLEWLVIPFKTNSEAVSDNETVSMIKLIAPPWKQLCRYIFSHQEYLHTMNPSDFELFAGEIFRSFGWDVEFTSRTRDGGYDVIAIRRAQPSNIRILVEAKRFAPRRTVGVDVIRSLYGVKQSKAASQLVLVTSSFVSLDAKKEFARVVPWELDFFERDKILEWCREQSSVKLSGEFSNLGPNKA